MSWTNFFLADITDQIGNAFSEGFRSSAGLLQVVDKHVLEPGVYSTSIPIPGAVTAATRSAGGQWTTQQPTDTTVTYSPNTEYGNHLSIDRLSQVGSKYLLDAFYLKERVGAIVDKLNDACWDLYSSITTNLANSPGGGTPDVSVLSIAKKKLNDAYVYPGTKYSVIGTTEEAAWTASDTWDASGPASQLGITEGVVGNKYGFTVLMDQRRKTLGDGTVNIALHPRAMGVCFRNAITPAPPGVLRSTYQDPLTGITLFIEVSNMNIATYGVGSQIECFLVAEPKIQYEKFACLIYG